MFFYCAEKFSAFFQRFAIDKVKMKDMQDAKPQLKIKEIEEMVAERLAEILVQQLEWQREQAQEKIKEKNKYGKDKRKIHNQ